MTTHRCNGSLKAGISIRYGKEWFDRKDAWRMWKPMIDSEWSTTVLTPIAEIHFCPFCGQKLMFPKISFTEYVPGQKQETMVRWDDE